MSTACPAKSNLLFTPVHPRACGEREREQRPQSQPEVHPRACGERGTRMTGADAPLGSSPRLRGTARFLGCQRQRGRFIPAPAGNGLVALLTFGFPPVHPRACGERSRSRVTAISPNGSSPRLRGTAIRQTPPAPPRRFIPAPAGNGTPRTEHLRKCPVHPRACGERLSRSLPISPRRGSSPRLRGTASNPRPGDYKMRFIPAPAGNGCGGWSGVCPGSVHPRACGERLFAGWSGKADHGSSPRLRGTDSAEHQFTVRVRFIPAPAGNGPGRTHQVRHHPVHPRACGNGRASSILLRAKSVHPRACGERCWVCSSHVSSAGSSPRLRGTDQGTQASPHCQRFIPRLRGTVGESPEDVRVARFIPAPAGNGRLSTSAVRRRTVHPRACGERCPSMVDAANADGSSPRLRGTGVLR